MTSETGDDEGHRRASAQRGRAGHRLEVTAIRGEEAFRRAKRHGRFVRMLRWTLPALALTGLGALVVMPYLSPVAMIDGLSFGQIQVDSNSLVMEQPRVSGFSGTRQSYALSADRAIQSLENPRIISLEGIDAEIGLGDAEGTARVDAGRGIYDSERETIRLQEGITVSTTNGYQARLQHADIDLKKGQLQSDEQVEITSASGRIEGRGLEISQGGRRILFKDGVTMTFTPNAPASDQTPRAASAPSAQPAQP